MDNMFFWAYVAGGIIFVWLVIWVMTLRKVVSTEVVHIVQRKSSTVSYGVGCKKNAYYKFPPWLPVLGVTVRALPVTNFDIRDTCKSRDRARSRGI